MYSHSVHHAFGACSARPTTLRVSLPLILPRGNTACIHVYHNVTLYGSKHNVLSILIKQISILQCVGIVAFPGSLKSCPITNIYNLHNIKANYL